MSIPLHCTNHHKFRGNKEHKKCVHGKLKSSDRNKPWLKEGSKVLERVFSVYKYLIFDIIRM